MEIFTERSSTQLLNSSSSSPLDPQIPLPFQHLPCHSWTTGKSHNLPGLEESSCILNMSLLGSASTSVPFSPKPSYTSSPALVLSRWPHCRRLRKQKPLPYLPTLNLTVPIICPLPQLPPPIRDHPHAGHKPLGPLLRAPAVSSHRFLPGDQVASINS